MWVRLSFLSVFLLAGGVAALACSGPSNLGSGGTKPGTDGSTGGGGGGAGGQALDGGTACSDFAAAKCAKFDSCTQGIYTEVYYASQAQCRSREEESCLGVLAAPGNTATPAGFEQCGKDIANAACADFFDLTNQTPACTPRSGPRANGQSCVNNGQCQSTWCYVATTAACGVCATRPAPGAPCTSTVQCGGNGMLCSQADTCAEVVAGGGACGMGNPCGFGLSCVGSTATTSGICQTAGTTPGAACDDGRTTAPLCNHDDGLFCPSATDMCAQSSLVDAGAVCGIIPGMLIPGMDASTPSKSALCGGGNSCEPPAAPSGRCLAAAADGAPCNTAIGPACLAPARCVGTNDAGAGGTCAILETTTACD